MNNENEFFYVDNGNGKKIKCKGLFTFHSDSYEKDYILYTDNIKGKSGNVNVYASEYSMNNGEITLTEITDDEEFAMLIKVFQEANKG